ncbi:hypothetical protein ABZP36_023862 [Zizania latifolia]
MDMVGVAAADSPGGGSGGAARPSRYESQKRRDWQTFGQYLRNHRPPLELARCSGAHVLEFLRYLDQFGKTKQKKKDQAPAVSAAAAAAAAAALSPAPADVLRQAPETAAHFLIPHAHFLHGHYFLALGGDHAIDDTAAAVAHAPVAGGEDMVFAMAAAAAAAEAHAAGCMMPLSVFN